LLLFVVALRGGDFLCEILLVERPSLVELRGEQRRFLVELNLARRERRLDQLGAPVEDLIVDLLFGIEPLLCRLLGGFRVGVAIIRRGAAMTARGARRLFGLFERRRDGLAGGPKPGRLILLDLRDLRLDLRGARAVSRGCRSWCLSARSSVRALGGGPRPPRGPAS
jgi:hypothetical protein